MEEGDGPGPSSRAADAAGPAPNLRRAALHSNTCLLRHEALSIIWPKMGLCSWPRGCSEPAQAGDVRCYYHAKVASGLIGPDWFLFENHTGRPPKERRERLAKVLVQVGAPMEMVEYARQVPMFPSHQSRHGFGFIRRGFANGYRF